MLNALEDNRGRRCDLIELGHPYLPVQGLAARSLPRGSCDPSKAWRETGVCAMDLASHLQPLFRQEIPQTLAGLYIQAEPCLCCLFRSMAVFEKSCNKLHPKNAWLPQCLCSVPELAGKGSCLACSPPRAMYPWACHKGPVCSRWLALLSSPLGLPPAPAPQWQLAVMRQPSLTPAACCINPRQTTPAPESLQPRYKTGGKDGYVEGNHETGSVSRMGSK